MPFHADFAPSAQICLQKIASTGIKYENFPESERLFRANPSEGSCKHTLRTQRTRTPSGSYPGSRPKCSMRAW
jgi:hypothetical protein